MNSFVTPLDVRDLDGEKWQVLSPLEYWREKEPAKISVPTDFVTDMGSIPAAAWWVIPPHGLWDGACVIHDFLYYLGELTRKQCDDILDEAMAALQVPAWRRFIIYRAVRIGANAAWMAHRKLDGYKV